LLEGRGSRHGLRGGGFVIDDTYNANPDSMLRAIQLLGEVAGSRRRVLVLGEMRELGAYAEQAHRDLGAQLVAARPAVVIGCGGLVELALDVAEQAKIRVIRTPDAGAAALLAPDAVLPEDAVLVKASRGVRAERVVHALRERLGER
jgi:UDP-N-acetylmuramoyl-tripeptide--D-alanyl-D-alanine ligase